MKIEPGECPNTPRLLSQEGTQPVTTPLSVPRVGFESTREDRALELFDGLGRFIEETSTGVFKVPSQDGQRTYEVRYGGSEAEESCTCPDHVHRGSVCVHLLAVGIRHASRRKPRSHSFECCGCGARRPLRVGVVVGAETASLTLLDEGELVCPPCARNHGVS